MMSLRLISHALLLAAPISAAVISGYVSQEDEVQMDHQAFQRLLDQVDPPALHAALHNFNPKKFKHGSFEGDRKAAEAIHWENPVHASSMVIVAKRQADNATTSLDSQSQAPSSPTSKAPVTTDSPTPKPATSVVTATPNPSTVVVFSTSSAAPAPSPSASAPPSDSVTPAPAPSQTSSRSPSISDAQSTPVATSPVATTTSPTESAPSSSDESPSPSSPSATAPGSSTPAETSSNQDSAAATTAPRASASGKSTERSNESTQKSDRPTASHTSLVVETTTLPDGSLETVTSVTWVSGPEAAETGGAAGATGTGTGPSGSLQSEGLAPRSRAFGWEAVGVIGGAVGFALAL
ncbi:MAG: hypothetical protein MMC23_000092 [Stictis urceolatum]|nr:hypothetical protein [Stictis urceolata]